jgi:dTDP-4-amino-4,6-dideoxy-D-galactose acyltransferase
MSSEIQVLDWDSNFFSKKIGKCEVQHDFIDDDFYNSAKYFDLVYVFSTKPIQINARLMDVKLTFVKQTSLSKIKHQDISFFDKKKFSYEQLLFLVYLSGHESRFLKDRFFNKQDFKRMYKKWIDNNLKNDYVLVKITNQRISGFVSYSVHENFSYIHLIAVHPDFQGQGIGKSLINELESNLKENSILKVPTQESNIGACNFYKAFGFKAITKQYIYHYEPNTIQ